MAVFKCLAGIFSGGGVSGNISGLGFFSIANPLPNGINSLPSNIAAAASE